MQAFVIYIQGHEESEKYSDRCVRSIIETESHLDIEKFPAITPENMWQVNYTWPLRKKITCPKTGLLLSAYKTYDNNKRIAAQVLNTESTHNDSRTRRYLYKEI